VNMYFKSEINSIKTCVE